MRVGMAIEIKSDVEYFNLNQFDIWWWAL